MGKIVKVLRYDGTNELDIVGLYKDAGYGDSSFAKDEVTLRLRIYFNHCNHDIEKFESVSLWKWGAKVYACAPIKIAGFDDER